LGLPLQYLPGCLQKQMISVRDDAANFLRFLEKHFQNQQT